MNLSIRKATHKDYTYILAMTKNTVDRCYRDWLGYEVVEKCLATNKLDLYIGKYLEHTWLLQKNTKTVAFTICVENMIDFLLVDVNYQKLGIGTELLKISEDMLFEDYSTISLESFKFNTKANSFLSINGWCSINEYMDPSMNTYKTIFIKKDKALSNRKVAV